MCLKPCRKGLGQWSLSWGGCGFLSLHLSLPLSFSCSSPPAHLDLPTSWQGTRERMEGGRDGEKRRIERRGMGVYSGQSSPGRLPPVQEDCTSQCHCMRGNTISVHTDGKQSLTTIQRHIKLTCVRTLSTYIPVFKYVQLHPLKDARIATHVSDSEASIKSTDLSPAAVDSSSEKRLLVCLWRALALACVKSSKGSLTQGFSCQNKSYCMSLSVLSYVSAHQCVFVHSWTLPSLPSSWKP